MPSGSLLACCLLTALAATLPAEDADTDWPNLRGPGWNSVSDVRGLADAWPAEGPPVLWSKEIGQGYSAVVAVGERIYTQTQTLYGQYVVCLHATTGAELWRHRYDWPYEAGNIYPGPRATPTFAANRIYFASPAGLIGCLDAESGAEIWSRNVLDDFHGRGTNFGYAASPLVIGERVYLPVGGPEAGVVALDAATGHTIWKAGANPASYCPVVCVTVAGRPYLVAFMQNSWMLLEPESGRLLEESMFSHGYDEHAALPLYEPPYLVLCSPFRGGAEALRLEATAAGEPVPLKSAPAWTSSKFSNDVCSSVVHQGRIFGFDLRDVQSRADRPSRGELRCLELATGRILWSTAEVGQASLIVADGKLILFNDRGELLLARETDARYEPLARTQVFSGEMCWTAPSLRGQRLYLRSPQRLACVYLGPPAALHPELAASSINARDLADERLFDGMQFVVGGELEFPFEPPTLPELWRWYAASLLGAFLPAVAISAGLGGLASRRNHPGQGGRWATFSFWAVLALLGVLATPLGNRLWHAFVFTWPVTLAAVCQLAFVQTAWAERQIERRQARWWSRGTGLLLFSVAIAYFHFCRRCGMTMEWAFLPGLLGAAPIAIGTAWYTARQPPASRRQWWSIVGGAGLTFTACFWTTGLYYLLRGYQETF